MLTDTFTINSVVSEDGQSMAAVDYEVFEHPDNKLVYINRVLHTGPFVDQLTFYRNAAKPNGLFFGVGRPEFRYTKSVEVLDRASNPIEAPLVIKVNASIPVGTNDTQIYRAIQVVGGLMAHVDIKDKFWPLQELR